jgi:chromosome segregation ATPase
VLGQLIELIECNHMFFRPVEVTAKERLFFTVVDSYDTSSRLMDQLARRNQGGRRGPGWRRCCRRVGASASGCW